ncbi:hypothetical protein ACS0TY_004938 [Phlomoides rotata]
MEEGTELLKYKKRGSFTQVLSEVVKTLMDKVDSLSLNQSRGFNGNGMDAQQGMEHFEEVNYLGRPPYQQENNHVEKEECKGIGIRHNGKEDSFENSLEPYFPLIFDNPLYDHDTSNDYSFEFVDDRNQSKEEKVAFVKEVWKEEGGPPNPKKKKGSWYDKKKAIKARNHTLNLCTKQVWGELIRKRE